MITVRGNRHCGLSLLLAPAASLMSAEVALELTLPERSPACLLAQWVSAGSSGLTG